MFRVMLVLAGLSVPAWAQLQLFQFDGTKETAVTALYQVPAAAPGDVVVTRFHVRNNGSGAISLTALSLAGANFTISSAPSLPYVIAPTSFVEFRISWAPDGPGSYSANVLVNTIAFIIRGTAVPAARLSSGTTILAAGATIDFGRIQWGTRTSQSLTLSNPNNVAVTVSSIAVSGAGFQGPSGISAPVTLNPGQTAAFEIKFAPVAGQVYNGTLKVDQRAFNLKGTGLDPPLPAASLVFATPTVMSAMQTTLSISLAAASQVSGTGTLVMEFQPSVAGVTDDPAVLFLSGPARLATVTVSPGDSVAKFGSKPNIAFQTGTTAGTLVFTLKLGNSTQQAKLTITPTPVNFNSATGTVEAGAAIVSLIGYDNTHSAAQLTFTFYDKSGKVLSPGAIPVDVTQKFQSYFQISQAGGAFALRASFLVSGDSSVLSSVDVAMTNSSGSTPTQHISFN